MFCPNCGSPLDEGAKFCPSCGAAREAAPQPAAPEPAAPRRKSRLLPGALLGAVLAAAVCAVLVWTGVLSFGGGETTAEGPGFRSPEAAAVSYLEALRDGDLDGMLAAFAVESYTENENQIAQLEWRSYYLWLNMGLLGDDPLVPEVNTARREAAVVSDIVYQYLTVTHPVWEDFHAPAVVDPGEGRAFLAARESPRALETLAEMEIGEPLTLQEALYETGTDPEDYRNLEQRILPETLLRLGADEVTAAAVPVEIDGWPYLFCPRAVCYEGRWYLLDFNSELGRSGTYGLVPLFGA